MDSNQQTQQPRQLQQWQQPQTQTQDQALSRVQEAFPRVQVLANSQTASPPPNSPNISTDEAVNSENTNLDTADDMGQFSKSGPRGQLVHRPDFSDVLSIEQTKQLQHLVSCILDGMNDEYKELWAIFGVNDNTKSARITGPIPLPAQFVTIPNPNSPKYAHLYGRKPLYPDGEGLKDGAAADGDSKPNAITDKTAAKPKPKFGKPPVPILPPGMTPNDMKAINAGNKPKIFGGPPVLTLPPGITPDMLPLKMPKTFQESLDMFGKKSIEERMRSDLGEMKRDTLAAFGKFKAAASKRIDLIVVRRGGNAGNVVTPREHLESKGTTSGTGRPVGSSAQNTNVGGRPQQQHKSLPIRTSATAQCQNSAGSGKFPVPLASIAPVRCFHPNPVHRHLTFYSRYCPICPGIHPELPYS